MPHTKTTCLKCAPSARHRDWTYFSPIPWLDFALLSLVRLVHLREVQIHAFLFVFSLGNLCWAAKIAQWVNALPQAWRCGRRDPALQRFTLCVWYFLVCFHAALSLCPTVCLIHQTTDRLLAFSSFSNLRQANNIFLFPFFIHTTKIQTFTLWLVVVTVRFFLVMPSFSHTILYTVSTFSNWPLLVFQKDRDKVKLSVKETDKWKEFLSITENL